MANHPQTETVRYGYGNEPSKPAEVTLYAEEGFDGATMLFADVERRRWVMTSKKRHADGELITTWDSRPNVRVTWNIASKAPAAPARKVAKVEAPRPAPRVHVPASAALSAEV